MPSVDVILSKAKDLAARLAGGKVLLRGAPQKGPILRFAQNDKQRAD